MNDCPAKFPEDDATTPFLSVIVDGAGDTSETSTLKLIDDNADFLDLGT